MIRFYGSPLCKDCVNLKLNCEKYGIEYEFNDINASLDTMRAFLKIRDTADEYAEIRGNNGIGIPVVVYDDGSITLDWQKVISDLGYEPFEEVKTSCSLTDRSGC